MSSSIQYLLVLKKRWIEKLKIASKLPEAGERKWRTDFPATNFKVALVVKNLPAKAGDTRDAGFTPGSGTSPGGRHGNPFQYSCLENPMDRGAWQATVQRVAKSHIQLTERLSTHTRTHKHKNKEITVNVALKDGPAQWRRAKTFRCRVQFHCVWGPRIHLEEPSRAQALC